MLLLLLLLRYRTVLLRCTSCSSMQVLQLLWLLPVPVKEVSHGVRKN